jgi:cytochrome o ubiquinol oxidase operon protein cyoD
MTVNHEELHHEDVHPEGTGDTAPGDNNTFLSGLYSYLIGLVLAVVLTAASFWAVQTHLIWGPGIPIALVVLAISQMGVHLTFFLHLTSSPDNTNNILALCYGLMIVMLVVGGSLWIMANLNNNMIPMDQMLQMQR